MIEARSLSTLKNLQKQVLRQIYITHIAVIIKGPDIIFVSNTNIISLLPKPKNLIASFLQLFFFKTVLVFIDNSTNIN